MGKPERDNVADAREIAERVLGAVNHAERSPNPEVTGLLNRFHGLVRLLDDGDITPQGRRIFYKVIKEERIRNGDIQEENNNGES